MPRSQQKRASGILGPGGVPSISSLGSLSSGSLGSNGNLDSPAGGGTSSAPLSARRGSVRPDVVRSGSALSSHSVGSSSSGGSPSAGSAARLSARLSKILDPDDDDEERDAKCLDFLANLITCMSKREVSKEHLLESKIIGLYFTASWSPPCKIFTAQLIDWYNTIRAELGPWSFEVVLCPLDADEARWEAYMQNMPWFSLVHSGREQIIRLFLHFKVQAAPTLVIISNDGSTIMENARGSHGFGFGCDPLKVYESLTNRSLTPKSGSGSTALVRVKQRSTLHAVQEEEKEEEEGGGGTGDGG